MSASRTTSFLILFVIPVAAAENLKHGDVGPKEEAVAGSCIESVSETDLKIIEEFKNRTKNLINAYSINANSKDRTKFNEQYDKLKEEYFKKISPNALNAIAAVYHREKFTQLSAMLQNDPKVKEAYIALNISHAKKEKAREDYKKWAVYSVRYRKIGDEYLAAANDTTEKMNALIKAISESQVIEPNIDPKDFKGSVKHTLVRELLLHQAHENRMDTQVAEMVKNYADGETAKISGLRDVAGAAAAIGWATYLTGGVGTKSAAIASGARVTSGLARLGTIFNVAAKGAVVGSVGGAGYGFMKGEVGVLLKSALSDDFMCTYVQEQSANADRILMDALSLAGKGAAIGATAGGLVGAGGLVATLTKGTLAAGGAVGTIYSGVQLQGKTRESYNLFEDAKKASEAGDEKKAREHLENARAAAVEAGEHGVELALMGAATAKTGRALATALKKIDFKAALSKGAVNGGTATAATTPATPKTSAPPAVTPKQISADNLSKLNAAETAALQNSLPTDPAKIKKLDGTIAAYFKNLDKDPAKAVALARSKNSPLVEHPELQSSLLKRAEAAVAAKSASAVSPTTQGLADVGSQAKTPNGVASVAGPSTTSNSGPAFPVAGPPGNSGGGPVAQLGSGGQSTSSVAGTVPVAPKATQTGSTAGSHSGAQPNSPAAGSAPAATAAGAAPAGAAPAKPKMTFGKKVLYSTFGVAVAIKAGHMASDGHGNSELPRAEDGKKMTPVVDTDIVDQTKLPTTGQTDEDSDPAADSPVAPADAAAPEPAPEPAAPAAPADDADSDAGTPPPAPASDSSPVPDGPAPTDPQSAESRDAGTIAHNELEEFPPVLDSTNPAHGPLPPQPPKEEGILAKIFGGIGKAFSSLFAVLFGWMKK